MNTDTLIFLGFFWFIGLFIGWFFRNGISIIGIIVILFLLPILTLISDLNWWPLTAAFVVGFLIHTWKPLYKKVQQL